MKKLTPWLKCLLGHRYYFIQQVSYSTKKIGCRRCGKLFAMNSDVRAVIPWDAELDALYEFLAEFQGYKIGDKQT